MVDERQPRIVEGARPERAARRGLPDGVDVDAVHDGPVVRRVDAERIVVALLAPDDAAPVAIATRWEDDTVLAVFQPTLATGSRRATRPWHYVLRLPAAVPLDAPLRVRVVGLGEPGTTLTVPTR